MGNILQRIWLLYYDGFRSMTVGRSLWLIILIKLFILFAVLKLFFFQDYLGAFSSDSEKSYYVGSELIDRSGSDAARN